MQQITEQWLAGAADMCELLARAFTYPDGTVAQALVEGSFQADMRSCAADVGLTDEVAPYVAQLDTFSEADVEELNDAMRRGFSRMFLVAGTEVPIFPYEGPYRFVADKRPGEPSLFSNRSAVDMIKRMQEAGVGIDTHRGEPADAIWFELAFLSHTYAHEFVAYQQHGPYSNEVRLWSDRRRMFVEAHGAWFIPFMESTHKTACELDASNVYSPLAQLAATVLPALLTSPISSTCSATCESKEAIYS